MLGDFRDKRMEADAVRDHVRKNFAVAARGGAPFARQPRAGVAAAARRGRAVDPDVRGGAGQLASLPLYIRTGPYLFVYAGIRPGFDLGRQAAEDLTQIREPFLLPATCFTVVFSHTSTERIGSEPGRIYVGPNKIGIDTG